VDALALVGDLMAGIERLFWIAEGAVVKDGQRFPGTVGGFFARSALPNDSDIRWWEADANIVKGRSYYERSEGEVAGGPIASAGAPAPSGQPAEVPRAVTSAAAAPAVRTWRGVGCGGRCTKDHPTSRDQYSGLFLGLFAAFRFVSDDGIRQRAADLMTRMLDYLLAHGWNVPLPPEGTVCTSYLGAFDHQLAFLRIGKTINPSRFDPIPQYYKFILSHAVISPTLVAEYYLALRQNYRRAYDILRRGSAHHRNAYFNLVRILVETPDQRAAASLMPSGSNPELSLAEEIKGTLAEWLARLASVKGPTGLPTDKVPDPAYLAALWPEASLYTTLAGGQIYLAPFPLSVDKRSGNGMEYAWQRDPFELGLKPGPHHAAIHSDGWLDDG
jgi:hypothetical protein